MAKCLRCGAGNEWIEPIQRESSEKRDVSDHIPDPLEGVFMAVIEASRSWAVCDVREIPTSLSRLHDAVAALEKAEKGDR